MYVDIDSLDGQSQPFEIRVERWFDVAEPEEPHHFAVCLVPETSPVGVNIDVTQLYLDGEVVPFQAFEGSHAETYSVKTIYVLPDLSAQEIRVELTTRYPEPEIEVVHTQHEELERIMD